MGFKAVLNQDVKGILEQAYPFDAVDENKEKAAQKFGKEFIIDFGIGDPTDPTPELVREACKKAVDARKTAGYPASIGHAEFKNAVSGFVKQRFNVSLGAEEIIATYGAKFASFHIPQIFLKKGNSALIPNPGYPPYTDGTLIAGGQPYYMNMLEENNFLPKFSEISPETCKNAGILFLNSPHSPTGRIYSKETLKEAVDFCIDNNIVLVSDECYSELYFESPPTSVLEVKNSEECSIVLNSLSKRSMMTGYAAGFLASKNPELLKPIDNILRKSIQGVPSFIQDAAVAAFRDFKHTEEMRAVYRERLGLLLPALEKTGCKVVKPEGTFFVWAKIPEKYSSALEFSEFLLLEKGINCVPGDLISQEFNGKNPGKGFVRFALVPAVEKIKEAAKRLGNG